MQLMPFSLSLYIYGNLASGFHLVQLAGGVEALALEVLNDVVPILPPVLQGLALNAIDYVAAFESGGIEELVFRVLGGIARARVRHSFDDISRMLGTQ